MTYQFTARVRLVVQLVVWQGASVLLPAATPGPSCTAWIADPFRVHAHGYPVISNSSRTISMLTLHVS